METLKLHQQWPSQNLIFIQKIYFKIRVLNLNIIKKIPLVNISFNFNELNNW